MLEFTESRKVPRTSSAAVPMAISFTPGGGGGGTQQSFIRGGSAPRSSPLPFYIPFLTEKVPLSYTFH